MGVLYLVKGRLYVGLAWAYSTRNEHWDDIRLGYPLNMVDVAATRRQGGRRGIISPLFLNHSTGPFIRTLRSSLKKWHQEPAGYR